MRDPLQAPSHSDVTGINARIPKLSKLWRRGTTGEVLSAWGQAIKDENQTDIPVKVSAIQVGSKTAAIRFLPNENNFYGCTRFAWGQLFARSAAQGCPASAAAEFAWWCQAPFAASVWNSVKSRGTAEKTLTARAVNDVHGGTGGRYIRAFISDKHSGADADDLVIVTNVTEFLEGTDGDLQGAFYGGTAFIGRDPGDKTEAWFSSRNNICEGVNARLSLAIQNSEVGNGSVSHGLYLSFTADGEMFNPESQHNSVHVQLPVEDAKGSSRHVGKAGERECIKLATNTMAAMRWSKRLGRLLLPDPNATRKTGQTHYEFFMPGIPDRKGLDSGWVFDESLRKTRAIVKDETSALFEVVMWAFCGRADTAQTIIKGISGTINPLLEYP